MKNNRSQLVNKMDNLLSEIKSEGRSQNFFDIANTYDIDMVKSTKVLVKEIPLALASDGFLFIIAKIINKIFYETIDINEYFTDSEIESYATLKYVERESKIIFKDVRRVPNTSDQFTAYIDVDDLMHLFDRNLLNYNFETQRDAKVKVNKGKLYESININKAAVREMTGLMLKGDFIPNFITFNVLNTGEEEIRFDENKGTLEVISGEVDVLDGYHRTVALHTAKKKNPLFKMTFGLSITNFDIAKAKRYIVQEDKKNPISQKHIASLNDDTIKLVIKTINEKSHDFKNQMTTDFAYINGGQALVFEDTIYKSIKAIFEVETGREAKRLGEYLASCFDELLGYLMERQGVKDINRIKTETILFDDYPFIAYIALFQHAKKIDDNAIEKVVRYIEENRLEFQPEKLTINPTRIREIENKIKKLVEKENA